MVYDAGDHFLFEFQVKDAISGFFKSSVKQVRVPVTKIENVEISKRRFGKRAGAVITMQAVALDTFREIPGMNGGMIELSVSRSNVPMAEVFVEGLYDNGPGK